MAPRVLVTGATGFVGSVLAERLVARGDRVRALVRRTSRTAALQRLGVELQLGDVSDLASLSAAAQGCELVLHLAGAVKALHPRELYRANAEGTRNVGEACASLARPPRLVYVSSLTAAGPAREGCPLREDDPPAPVSDYGASKLAGERGLQALAGAVPVSIVRAPIVYGPGDRELMPQLLLMARLGLVVRMGFGEKRYSILHVSDLCDGILAVAERGQRLEPVGSRGLYYLDDGAEHTWDEIGLAACEAVGCKARVLPLPEIVGSAAAAGMALAAALTRKASILSFDKLKELRQRAWVCSSERARRELDFAPRFGLEVGMADAVDWFQARRGR